MSNGYVPAPGLLPILCTDTLLHLPFGFWRRMCKEDNSIKPKAFGSMRTAEKRQLADQYSRKYDMKKDWLA